METDLRRIFLLSSVLLLLTKVCFTDQAILDPDLGWHLKTGEWILQHRTVPRTDPFSQFGLGQPWVAYSWLFELLLASVEQIFHLPGIIGLTVALASAIFTVLFLLLRATHPQPVVVMGLLLVGLIAFSPLIRTPRPWLFSILFFVIEFHLVQRARRMRQFGYLLWLPILFLLWANIHIQFIYGLFLLGLLLLESCSFRSRGLSFNRTWLSQTTMLMVACSLATLVTPYSWHLYETLWEIIRQTGVYERVQEMQAMSFRGPADWAVLALTVGAAYALGQTRRKDRLLVVLFIVGLFVAYRARRDIWFLLVPCLYILADHCTSIKPHQGGLFTPRQWFASLLIVLVVNVASGHGKYLHSNHLEAELNSHYPKGAIDFIDSHTLPGPIYNPYGWGGYLIWRLPEWRVSIDGRANLHGDERLRRYQATWGGLPHWAEDPELVASGLVVAPSDTPLASLLKTDPRFTEVYADQTATVFAGKQASNTQPRGHSP